MINVWTALVLTVLIITIGIIIAEWMNSRKRYRMEQLENEHEYRMTRLEQDHEIVTTLEESDDGTIFETDMIEVKRK